jgi:hypothetical protein
MPDKNEEPDSTSDCPLGGLPADRVTDGRSQARASASVPLQAALDFRRGDRSALERSAGRISQLFASFWRSLACLSQGPVQHPRAPLLTGLRLGSSYFLVSKKEVA